MLGQELRDFAITLLDDDHGINSEAWDALNHMLYDNGDIDIIATVQVVEGRYLLPSATVAHLRSVLSDFQ